MAIAAILGSLTFLSLLISPYTASTAYSLEQANWFDRKGHYALMRNAPSYDIIDNQIKLFGDGGLTEPAHPDQSDETATAHKMLHGRSKKSKACSCSPVIYVL